MKASTEWINIAYQAKFDVPLFDLATRSPEFQQHIYKAIRSDYPYALSLADMHLFTSGIQAKTELQIKMFHGNVSVNLTRERLAIDFSDINWKTDLNTCKTCIDLVWKSLFQTWTDMNRSLLTDLISTSLSLRADGAARHLEDVVPANEFYVDPTQLDATERHPAVVIELGNSKNGWRAMANATAQTQDNLLVFCQTQYNASSIPLTDRVAKQLDLVNLILHGIKVEL